MSDLEPSSQQAGAYEISLPSFEGPLDLLLHLCQKHELDILEIPIGFVTEKYLEYLAVMQLLDLDLASEYLVMAATLAHIKSKMLLPAPPPGQEDDATAEEEEDPREALIRRLLEYQKYKQAAADLSALGVTGRDVFFRGMKLEEAAQTGLPPLAQVQLFSLVEAFQGVLAKSKIKLSHDIVHERMTLTDRINELVDLLRVRKRLAFEELFEGLVTRFDLVITFLALLEMTKLRMTRLSQEDPTGPIHVEFTATSLEGTEAEGIPAQAHAVDETAAAGDGLDAGPTETEPENLTEAATPNETDERDEHVSDPDPAARGADEDPNEHQAAPTPEDVDANADAPARSGSDDTSAQTANERHEEDGT